MKYIIQNKNKKEYIAEHETNFKTNITTNRLRALKFKIKENATAYLNTSILPAYSEWEVIEYLS